MTSFAIQMFIICGIIFFSVSHKPELRILISFQESNFSKRKRKMSFRQRAIRSICFCCFDVIRNGSWILCKWLNISGEQMIFLKHLIMLMTSGNYINVFSVHQILKCPITRLNWNSIKFQFVIACSHLSRDEQMKTVWNIIDPIYWKSDLSCLQCWVLAFTKSQNYFICVK